MSTKTSETIQIEYNQIISQAALLEEYVDQLNNQIALLESRMSTTTGGWQGDGSVSYIKKCEELKIRMTEIAKSMASTASNIKSMAETYRKAELAALKIAEIRTWIS